MNLRFLMTRLKQIKLALSSKELDKYEYLTGDDLALKPGPSEIKWPEYSPLAQIITKAIKEMIK